MTEGEQLVTYCGLYCGDCFAHKGTVADLARDLRKELRQAKFERTARAMAEIPFFAVYKDYPKCYEVLGAMVKFRCHKGCRNGGGPPFCKIRKCCQKKDIAGCWQCDEFENCGKLEFLQAVHDDGHLKNLAAIKRKGIAAFISGKRYW